jgi:uncharacterized protein
MLVTDGALRANFAALTDNDAIGAPRAGIEIKPELPWQGYRESDYVAQVFAEGRVVELTLDLQPTAWTFRAGHRVRISLAGADWPTFELHPGLSPHNDPEDPENVRATLSIHHDLAMPSRVVLPIIPEA